MIQFGNKHLSAKQHAYRATHTCGGSVTADTNQRHRERAGRYLMYTPSQLLENALQFSDLKLYLPSIKR
jgi:hypothetical protein